MKFHPLKDLIFDPEDTVLRRSWQQIAVGITALTVTLFTLIYIFGVKKIPVDRFDWIQVVVCFGIVLLFVLYRYVLFMISVREQPTSWLVCFSQKTLYINPWANQPVPQNSYDHEAVSFSYGELTSANAARIPMSFNEKLLHLDLSDQEALEITFSQQDSLRLNEYLRQRVKNKNMLSLLSFKIERRGSIIIPWCGIPAPISQILKFLNQKINFYLQQKQDSVILKAQDSKTESGIFYLVKTGDYMKAIALAKEVFGISTDEAKKLVEKLAKQVQGNSE